MAQVDSAAIKKLELLNVTYSSDGTALEVFGSDEEQQLHQIVVPASKLRELNQNTK